MNRFYLSQPFVACYENSLDAYVPELWANEGLAILEANMPMASLVNRNFEAVVARFGDVVNTRKPGSFKIRRKTDGTTLVQQDATATNVPVTLNQWFYESFVIRDGEGSKSFQELTDIYLRPAMISIAEGIERALLGRVHAFLGTPAQRVGRLGGLSASNAKDYVLEARQALDINKAPAEGRRLVLAPTSETAMLKTDLFLKANERGDGGLALTQGVLGHILGFDTYKAQNVNSVLTGADTEALALTEPHAAGFAGSLEIVVTGTANEYVNVDGNDQPTYMTDATSGAVVLNEALKYAVLDNAVVTRYKKCVIKGSYALGWSKVVTVDGHTSGKPPQVGQLIAFGTGGTRKVYTVIETDVVSGTETDLYLDRPVEVALVNDENGWPGPYGSMNLAFHRDALALVTRPLALPDNRTGVMSAVVPHNGIGMRVLMQYDINAGGMIVSCDILAGVAVLDSALCVPILG